MRSGHLFGAAMSSIVALIVCVCIVGAVQTRALALDPLCNTMNLAEKTWSQIGGNCRLTDYEKKFTEDYFRQMAGQEPLYNELHFRDQSRAKTAFGRAMDKANMKLGPRAAKAGKYGAPVVIGATLLYLGADGIANLWNTDQVLTVSKSNPQSNTWYSNTLKGESIPKSVTWSKSGNVVYVTFSYSAVFRDTGFSMYSAGQFSAGPVSKDLSYGNISPTPAKNVWFDNTVTGQFNGATGSIHQGQVRYQTADGATPQYFPVGPKFTVPAGDVAPTTTEMDAPTYTTHDTTNIEKKPAEYVPPNDREQFTPQHTWKLIEQVKADPEYSQARIPHTDPQHGEIVETRQNPDGSVTHKYADGTEVTVWPDGWEYKDPDGSTGSQPGTWTRPDGEPKPESETAPHAPPGDGGNGTPTDPNLSCPASKEPNFIIPPVDFEEKFPFSLIVSAFEILGQLVGPPQAPVFELPMIGTQDLSRFDGAMATMRTVFLVLIGGILMPLMFFRLIKGGGE